jgi:hypothetical protein
MRIEGERAVIEFGAGEEPDEYFSIVDAAEFQGRNARFGVDANVLRKFVSDLRELERVRRGEARLNSAMSPDTFDLTIRILDSAGHVAARATVGRWRYEGHQHCHFSVVVEFLVDPTTLPRLVIEAEGLLR